MDKLLNLYFQVQVITSVFLGTVVRLKTNKYKGAGTCSPTDKYGKVHKIKVYYLFVHLVSSYLSM